MKHKKPTGRALTLSCGPDRIHITLVFFHNLYEPKTSQVKEIATKWLKEHYPSNQIEIILGNNWGGRSFLVSGEIINLQKNLISHFQHMGYQMDISERAFTPHVDTRGRPKSVVQKQITNLTESLTW